MTYSEIECFLAICHYKTGSRAAEALYITQPSLSTRLKTLEKRGCVVTMKPFVRSSVEICLRTDRDPAAVAVKQGQVDVLDWSQIDFSRFTFDSNDGVRDIAVNTRVRNYRRLQFVVRSSALNEGFGIYQITKTFRLGKVAG